MNFVYRLIVIVFVVFLKIAFVILRFFVLIRVELVWCNSFFAKVIKSSSFDDRLISLTVRFGYDFVVGGWN